MTASLLSRVSRKTAFVGFNAAVLLVAILYVVVPLVERFSDRADAIAQDGADLARQQSLRAEALSSASGATPGDDPFLPGQDESTANADLQQSLQDLVRLTGARFVSVRGLVAARGRPEGRMVTARLDVEGSLTAIAALVQAIEGHAPSLFIGALTLRANGAGPAASPDDLDAQLTVLGAFRRPRPAREG